MYQQLSIAKIAAGLSFINSKQKILFEKYCRLYSPNLRSKFREGS